MLMEACLGGELWTVLRDKGHFDDGTTRFYTACVVEAFDYLHSRNIIYRDLKPENLLLDNQGYVKLVDFGFAKRLDNGRKTWTFCDTPEYVAPKVILNKDYDISADYLLVPWRSHVRITYGITTCLLTAIRMLNIQISRTINKLLYVFSRIIRQNVLDIKEAASVKYRNTSLKTRTLDPSILPRVQGSTDTANFDAYPADSDPPLPDDISGWDNDF
ncbi:Uncharacterized protein DBV15_10819 [Temnothorax longispinosus]|uniref:Protein kinase domain-containing protein n=1 Tax=Temnothorax longispinosus TaxID=300112 RepID=A0A4S2JGP2_9HYME|nr:Uncharacterized protein DBV15_10819 [Temnothorax longispinosus]